MPTIQIVTGTDPDPIVTYAAGELRRYVHELFNRDAAIVEQAGQADATAHLVSDDAPTDDQSFILRCEGDKITAGGGSPRATMWAVYELVERWGVRYTLHGDIYPEHADTPGGFAWPDIDQTFTPNLRCRCWRLVNGFCLGPESWGIDEYRRFLDQAAKMKYSEVFLNLWPWQSFVHYEFNGVKKSTGTSFFDMDYPVDDDTIGREVFGGAERFENPDFGGITDYRQRYEAAVQHVKAIMAHAAERGMTIGIGIHTFEYPLEFLDALPGSETAHQLNRITCRPGKGQPPDDPMVIDLARTIIRAYVQTYPEAEYVYICAPEHREFIEQAPAAWLQLDERFGVSDVMTLEDAIAAAGKRTQVHGGAERQISRVKGDTIALGVLTRVFEDRSIFDRPGREPMRPIYNSVADEVYPILPKLGPPGAGAMPFIDYTARRAVDQIDAMDYAPVDQMDCRLIFTLADDNVGVLPQLAGKPIHELAMRMRELGWHGFTTRYWIIGDLDPTVHYLARSCWDGDLTPQQAYADLADNVFGKEAGALICNAWDIIEQNTDGFDRHGISYGFPVPGMLLKHFDDAEVYNEPLHEVRDGYEKAHAIALEALAKTRAAGRKLMEYHTVRMQFAVQYMDATGAVREAGLAYREGDKDKAIGHLESAMAQLVKAIETHAAIVRDSCDRGVIAVLNRECYRPLRNKLAELKA